MTWCRARPPPATMPSRRRADTAGGSLQRRGSPPRSCWGWWCGQWRCATRARPNLCSPPRTRLCRCGRAPWSRRRGGTAVASRGRSRPELVRDLVPRAGPGRVGEGRPPAMSCELSRSVATCMISTTAGGPELPPQPAVLAESHRSLLRGLLDGPCFAGQGDLIVVWQDPETGCARP